MVTDGGGEGGGWERGEGRRAAAAWVGGERDGVGVGGWLREGRRRREREMGKI